MWLEKEMQAADKKHEITKCKQWLKGCMVYIISLTGWLPPSLVNQSVSFCTGLYCLQVSTLESLLNKLYICSDKRPEFQVAAGQIQFCSIMAQCTHSGVEQFWALPLYGKNKSGFRGFSWSCLGLSSSNFYYYFLQPPLHHL